MARIVCRPDSEMFNIDWNENKSGGLKMYMPKLELIKESNKLKIIYHDRMLHPDTVEICRTSGEKDIYLKENILTKLVELYNDGRS